MSYEVGAQCGVERRPVAAEIMELAESVQKQADLLVRLTEERLSPVILACPSPATTETKQLQNPYPPLFDQLRGRLNVIQQCLYQIEDSIRKVEL